MHTAHRALAASHTNPCLQFSFMVQPSRPAAQANSFVRDVNYPTNMHYAGAMSAAGRLYELPEMVADVEKVRDTIRRQSFDGDFFDLAEGAQIIFT